MRTDAERIPTSQGKSRQMVRNRNHQFISLTD